MKIFNHITYPKAFIKLKPSKVIKGEIGAFALKNFKKGEILVKSREFEDNYSMKVSEYNKLDSDLKELVKAHSTITKNLVYLPRNINYIKPINYFNHSCDSNTGFDQRNNYVATRNIAKGEEFFLDYSFLNTNPDYQINCRCRSKKCRGIVSGNEWKNKDFVKKFNKYFASTVRSVIKSL